MKLSPIPRPAVPLPRLLAAGLLMSLLYLAALALFPTPCRADQDGLSSAAIRDNRRFESLKPLQLPAKMDLWQPDMLRDAEPISPKETAAFSRRAGCGLQLEPLAKGALLSLKCGAGHPAPRLTH